MPTLDIVDSRNGPRMGLAIGRDVVVGKAGES